MSFRFPRFFGPGAALSVFVSAALIFSLPAHAQVLDNDIGSSPNIRVGTPLPPKPSSKTTVPPFSHPEAIFTNPFGIQTWLRDHGINILLDNTNEFAGAITPPTKGNPRFVSYKQGASNAGQYADELDIDWDKLAGIRGLATHMITVGRYGTTANRMFGDWLNHSSEDYGGGGNVVVHLVLAYAEETLLGGRIALAAGRMPEVSDFAASSLFCNFMNNSMCGRPKGITDSNFSPGYPASTWAFRARFRPTRLTYAQFGVYPMENGVYAVAQHRTGFKFNGSNIIGFTVPLEIGVEPLFGNGSLPGHYKLGVSLLDEQQPDNLFDSFGDLYALSGRSQRMHGAGYSSWGMFDQRLVHFKNGGKDSGITALTGVVYNDPHTSVRQWEGYVAFLDRGFWPSRPFDTIGLAFTYTRIAPGVTLTDQLLLEEGKALPNHATGVQSHAEILEANYAIHVMRGVIFQPVFEYYFNPNGQDNLRNAAMLGFKSHVEFF
ncbi:carbohydrate porin [Tanticharoenia sakaeratensis]|uniref:Carbohydrate-selective porin n=1 Tax=Tanticharoenia sakaeratensis NBRC 103193 TaxID=1231623 RepID=A0A0D6MM64_9PROT|nr:carbohydrate porin [Tanticharoenia sakaeratensis]GAN54546.1 carbohydrate-selective porin [Tanticharoenia sakaeratensis NBRC 103193]GBQ24468.1 carbohydrate-selective porin B [Tanticharoenia sakaeratensis NBRC 103193]